MTTNTQIKDLKTGEMVELYGVVSVFEERTKTDNSKYVELRVEDKSGTIDGKIWDISIKDLPQIEVGKLVKIRGLIKEWNSKKQLHIQKHPSTNKPLIRLTTEEDGVSIDDYLKCAPIETKLMLEDLKNVINNFSNEDIKLICAKFVEEYKNELLCYPGAQNLHHSVKGGLLYHIHTMLNVATPIADNYPNINNDLLFAGVILHDIGKIRELDVDENGKASKYTDEGYLLGHTIQGIKMLNEIVFSINTERDVKLDKSVVLLLEHMIASHHFDEMWGAYQKPAFLEAEILHHLDMIDSRVNMVNNVTETLEPNTFSERQWFLNERRIYKHSL